MERKTDIINVSIVEDDKLIRESLGNLITDTPGFFVSSTFGDCESMLKEIEKNIPDVMLMDIELPGMWGTEGIGKLKKRIPEIDIIVFTVHENNELVFKALCAGACGYLTKNTPPDRILESIREARTGGAPMSTHIARMVVGSFKINTDSPLTARETEVIEQLSKGQSYKTIADKLFIDKETVRTHIKNIYSKLEVHSRAAAVEKALKEKFI